MRIDLAMQFHPGHGARPRPSLKITAKALRRGAGQQLEELVHTRLIDCPFPDTLRGAMDVGLDRLQQLRHGRDWWYFDALGQDQLRQCEITVG
jgi:hypothetical protein